MMIPAAEILSTAKDLCSFTEEQLEKLSSILEEIEKDPVKKEKFFRDFDFFIREQKWDDNAGDETGEDKGSLHLVVALAGAKEVIRLWKKGDFPPLENLYEALCEIRVWMEYHEDAFGAPGLMYENGFAWVVQRLFTGSVIRFGRLEYNKSSCFGDILVFEHKVTRERKVMLNGNYPFDVNGRITDKEKADFFSVAAASLCFGGYAGNPVRRDGSVGKEYVTLDRKEWKRIFGPGDDAVYIHIPAGAPLTGVEESLKRMKKYFFNLPDFHPKGVICSSWLFSPVLPEILGENSNLVKFRNLFHNLPATTTAPGFIGRVFGERARKEGIRSVPWNTTLRQKLGEKVEKGEKIPGGRVLILPDEIEG